MYRRKLGSTHGGNCTVRECRAVIAWSGLGEVVDTASMTEGCERVITRMKRRAYVRQDGSKPQILRERGRLRHISEVRPTRESELHPCRQPFLCLGPI